MTVISITKARAQLYTLIGFLQKGQPPVLITGKNGNAVLVSEDEWRSISETLHLLSVPGMKESIQEGMREDIASCAQGHRSMRYRVVYSKQAVKDAKKLKKSALRKKAKKILELIAHDPFTSPPTFEKLVGDLEGVYSRRLNEQHRIVYQVYKREKVVKILRLWTHYE